MLRTDLPSLCIKKYNNILKYAQVMFFYAIRILEAATGGVL